MQKQPQIPDLSAKGVDALRPFLDDLNRKTQAVQQHMTQAATVLLSITAPLSASRPASGTPAVLLACAVMSTAVSLLAGLLLLHAPARQSREGAQTVLQEVAAAQVEQRAIRPLTISTAWNRSECLCAWIQPAALIVSVVLLTISASISAC